MPRSPRRLSLAWTTRDGVEALRVTGLPAATLAQLRDAAEVERARHIRICTFGSEGIGSVLAGRYEVDAAGLDFVPRYPFLTGSTYAVQLASGTEHDASDVSTITRLPATNAPPTTVVDIHPACTTLPRNALRLYVSFSAPMREGASAHIRLRRTDTGADIEDAFLPVEDELWDADGQRLTVLFDPARIKRGLRPHEELSYPLREGVDVEVTVDAAALDAGGRPLRDPYQRHYAVGPDVRTRVDPSQWGIGAVGSGVRDALVVTFDRPLDHALVPHCLTVVDDRDARVQGDSSVDDGRATWYFVPFAPWPPGELTLTIDPDVEDLAGNSVTRVFDRDLSLSPGGTPLTRLPVPRRATSVQ